MLRFPDGMRDRIREAAAENGRSMNAEIISRLDATFAGRAVDGMPLTVEAARDELKSLEAIIAKADGILFNEQELERFTQRVIERTLKAFGNKKADE